MMIYLCAVVLLVILILLWNFFSKLDREHDKRMEQASKELEEIKKITNVEIRKKKYFEWRRRWPDLHRKQDYYYKHENIEEND